MSGEQGISQHGTNLWKERDSLAVTAPCCYHGTSLIARLSAGVSCGGDKFMAVEPLLLPLPHSSPHQSVMALGEIPTMELL